MRTGAPAGTSADTPAQPAHSAAQADSPGPAFLPGEPGGPPISSNPATIAAQQPSAVAPKPEAATPSPAAKPDLTQSIVAGMRDHDGALGNGAPATQVASTRSASFASRARNQKPLPVLRTQTLQTPVSAAAGYGRRVACKRMPPDIGGDVASGPDEHAGASAGPRASSPRLGALVADQRKEVDQLASGSRTEPRRRDRTGR